MFSVASPSGPIPVWDVEALLLAMAKQPAGLNVSLTTAATKESTVLTAPNQLANILLEQMHHALSKASAPSLSPSSNSFTLPGKFAYLIPLTEPAFPLVLSLRRATWWVGQGYEPQHFAGIGEMTNEAAARKLTKEQMWNSWLVEKATVRGQVKRQGELWVPNTKTAKQRLWKRV